MPYVAEDLRRIWLRYQKLPDSELEKFVVAPQQTLEARGAADGAPLSYEVNLALADALLIGLV